MANFVLDQTKTPEENIEAFFAHLEGIDPAFARLLRENIRNMPLSESSDTERNQARQTFNRKVAAFLDQMV